MIEFLFIFYSIIKLKDSKILNQIKKMFTFRKLSAHVFLIGLLINEFILCKNECCFNSSFAYRDNKFVSLLNFEKFSQLNFNCNLTIELSGLQISPLQKLILDSSLNLTGIQVKRINGNLPFFVIILSNLKGIDLHSYSFDQIKFDGLNSLSNYNQFWWKFANFAFEFYFNGNLINREMCNEKFAQKMSFPYGKIIDMDDDYISFSTETCPFVFKNANIDLINIGKISDTYLKKNLLGFQNVSAVNLNSFIFQLNLKLYHVYLNDKLLNMFVFENLRILDLNGPIVSIQSDMFKSLEKLGMLRLRSQNMRKQFARHNKWLNSLNLKINYHFILVLYQAISNVSFYEYPDEDFCHFKSFPHQKEILPKLQPVTLSKCTCLELFLIQNSAKYSDIIEKVIFNAPSSYDFFEFYSDSILNEQLSICINESFLKVIRACNFGKRLNNCQIQQANEQNLEDNFLFYIYDWIEISNIIRIIFPKYVNLVFAIVGILINLIFIFILSNKNIIKDKMYTYLLIHSYFNLFYSVTILTNSVMNHFITISINFIFLESIIYSQYVQLILAKFISNVFKTSSNISYFAFVLSRYFNIKNDNSTFDRFKWLNIKKFLLISLIFSILINANIIFEFNIRESSADSEQLKPIESQFILDFRQDPIDDYKENFSTKSEYILLNVSQYIKLIFSDLAHIIVSTIVDCFLLAFVKNKLKQKQTLLNARGFLSVNLIHSIRQVRLKKKQNQPKDRITQMIILNGINFLVLRLPVALISFYGFVFRYDQETKTAEPSLFSYIICKEKRLCASLHELFLCSYLVSFIFQFFIFYKLDTNFKLSFKNRKNSNLRPSKLRVLANFFTF